MNKISRDNWILISLILFAVGVVLADVLLNKNSIIRESFQTFNVDEAVANMAVAENTKADTRSETEHVKSVISKYTGKVINVDAVGVSPTQKVTVPVMNKMDTKMNVSVNSNGTYSLVIPNATSSKQQFALIYIDSAATFSQHIPLPNENLGYNIQDASYPFYILKSVFDPTKALQYQEGNLTIRPLANYDTQKWDISYDTVSETGNRFSGDVSESANTTNNADMETIKIKLNVNDQVLNRLLEQKLDGIINVSNGNTDSELDTNEGLIDLGCPLDSLVDDSVPPSAVASLCPGCNPNNL
jgi:hypothetical protein